MERSTSNQPSTPRGRSDVGDARSAHTPGPWTPMGPGYGGLWNVHVLPSYYVVADVRAWDDQAQTEANARLISAAPDLLEACRAADDAIDEMERNMTSLGGSLSYLQTCARTRVRAAIAKAEGGRS